MGKFDFSRPRGRGNSLSRPEIRVPVWRRFMALRPSVIFESESQNQEFDQTISLRGGDFCRSDDGGACGLEAGKIDRRRPQLRAQPDPGLHGSCEPGTAHALGARSP